MGMSVMVMGMPVMMPVLVQEPQIDACSACETAVGLVQKNSASLEKLLDGLCDKLNNTAAKAACDGAVETAVNVLNSQTSQQICTELKLCKSFGAASSLANGQLCGSCQQYVKTLEFADCRGNPLCEILSVRAATTSPDQMCKDMNLCAEGWVSG